jgi:anaerobic ribonucleoside-triphosphate reductase
MTDRSEFYDEQKWCEQCKTYVRFLMSVNFSYCVHCGGRVRLFSRMVFMHLQINLDMLVEQELL